MTSYTCEISPRFININDIADPIIKLTEIDGINYNPGDYYTTLTPVAPQGNTTFVFTNTVSLSVNQINITNRTWSLPERGFYTVGVTSSNLGDTINLINNKFYVYSYGTSDDTIDVAFTPNLINNIEPGSTSNIQFTLYRLSIDPFPNSTYTFSITDCDNPSVVFTGSTSVGGNPIYITIPVNLSEPFETYCFNTDLIGNNCDYDLLPSTLEIQTLCFIEGTKILTLHDGYIPIQHLEPGTLIKTYGIHQFLPLKYLYKTKINYKKTNNKLNKLFKYEKHRFGLIEDLVVSGGHSILVDELNDNEKKLTNQFWNEHERIENKYKLLACIDSRNTEFEQEGIYNMYQIVLESEEANKQFGIYANGILTETMSIDFYKQHTSKKNQ
jgi:hypothetical protein